MNPAVARFQDIQARAGKLKAPTMAVARPQAERAVSRVAVQLARQRIPVQGSVRVVQGKVRASLAVPSAVAVPTRQALRVSVQQERPAIAAVLRDQAKESVRGL